jgi:O-antigen/teichoic acid export membrane protein
LLYPAQLLAVFGAGFAAGATALIVLACGELVNASTGICGSIIDMTGQTKLKLINSVTWFISIVGLNVLLIPRWGVMGTAVATFVSISIVNILRALEVWFLYHIHPYNLTFAKPLVAALSTFGLMTLLNRWFSPGMNPIYVIIHIALLFVLYGGILFLMGFSPEERVIITRMYKRTISLLNNSRELLSARFSTTRLSKKNL